MAIQIIGLRDFVDKNGIKSKKQAFYRKGWRAPSVKELFANIDSYIEKIPVDERWNLYYTVANCYEEPTARVFNTQNIIPFDLDGIDMNRLSDYQAIVAETLEVDQSDMGIICTGNGLHFLVGSSVEIIDDDYFEDNRHHYKAICDVLNLKFKGAKLPGDADPVVFCKGRLLRLPSTENRKPKKGVKQSYMIQPHITYLNKTVVDYSPIPDVDVGDAMNSNMIANLELVADEKGIREGCNFIRHCHENQNEIEEPAWYAMLSIIGRCDRAAELIHEYSEQAEGYTPQATILKWEQALSASGPRTCDSINDIYGACSSCPNFGKCTSPIQLMSEEHIRTEKTGFHTIFIKDTGVEKKVPSYSDLMKYFNRLTPFTVTDLGGNLLTHNGTHWVDCPNKRLDQFAEENFIPEPDNKMCTEFKQKVLRNNIKELDWYNEDGLINFNNGVLNVESLELGPHSTDFGFKYCLPFDYDPSRDCPRFDLFMDEITCNDKDLQYVLLEFMAYSLSNIDASLGQKALILLGEGANGKSVFMDVLKHMAGYGNYCTLNMGHEISKLENRYQLDGKLFNVSEETPAKAMMENSVFKSMVTGGDIQARKLYCDSYTMKSTAKIILACNDLPETNDRSNGMFRRLLIAPFKATFDKETMDRSIREKLYVESSGIFNKVLIALARFKGNKYEFTSCQAIDNQIESYKLDNNTVLEWFRDGVTYSEGEDVLSTELYLDYKATMEEMGHRPLNNSHFARELVRLNPEYKTRQKRIGGTSKRYLTNHKLVKIEGAF